MHQIKSTVAIILKWYSLPVPEQIMSTATSSLVYFNKKGDD